MTELPKYFDAVELGDLEGEDRHCDKCFAKMNARWVSLSSRHVDVLRKMSAVIIKKGMNTVEFSKELPELTRWQYCNYQQLRYFGLAYPDRSEDSGIWFLTRRGIEFLRGGIAIRKKVQVFRNRLVRHEDCMNENCKCKFVPAVVIQNFPCEDPMLLPEWNDYDIVDKQLISRTYGKVSETQGSLI